MRSAGKLLLLGLALAAVAPPAAAKNYVYILTGQSNSLGAVKGSPATDAMLERFSSSAKLWNGNMVRDTGVCFEKSPAWVQVAPQLPRYGHLCMGPEYGFAYMMQRHGWHTSGADKLFIIKASLDGGGNSFWLPKGAAWSSLSASVKKARAALRGDSKVQALLYLQGESDKGEEITLAPTRFLNMHARLKKVVGQGLRYAVAGECATWNGREEKDAAGHTTASLMCAMADKEKHIGWVRTRDLSKITSGDQMGVHYDGRSQLTIGARYAYATALLEKLPLTPTRGDHPQAALNTRSAWWGGMLPGEHTVATWDLSAANVQDTLSGKLAVAGLAVEYPFRGGVSISASGAAAQLSVGAEGIQLRGGSLELLCAVHTAADQTWALAPGCTLTLGSAAQPVSLSGSGCITLAPAADSAVELHLSSPPPQRWKLAAPSPGLRLFINGQAASFKPLSDGTFKLVPAPPSPDTPS